MINFGEVPAGAVLPIPFAAYASTGASVTLTGLAVTDIEVYKGTSMTQRASDNGYALMDTDGIDLDGITGIHGFSIDTGDNSDSGFYAVGSYFTVIVSAVTIDGQTVNFIAATFRIKAAESVAGYPKADVSHFGGTAGTFASGIPEVKVASIAANAIDSSAIAADAIGSSELAASAASEIATAVRTELATELGRIDAATSTRATQTSVDTIDGIVDAILIDTAEIGSAGAGLTALASASDLATVAGYIDTEIGTIITNLATVDTVVDTIQVTTDKLETMLEATSDAFTFTPDALQFAPTGGTGGLDAAGVRAAIGLASANLDTQLSGINSKTTNLPSDPADQSLVIAATTAIYDRIGAPANASISADIAAVKSQTSDIETDTQDIQTRLPAALVSGRIDASVGAMQNDVVTAAAVAANAIDASALAADAVAEIADAVWDEAVSGHTSSGTFGKALDDADDRGARTVIRGTVDSGSTTTSIVTSAFAPAGAAADQFKGRIVIFDNDTATAELRGQATDITASTNSATPTLTVTALTTAPASGDVFSVL